MRTFFAVVTTIITMVIWSVTAASTLLWYRLLDPALYLQTLQSTNTYQRVATTLQTTSVAITDQSTEAQLLRSLAAGIQPQWLQQQSEIVLPVIVASVRDGSSLQNSTTVLSLAEPKRYLVRTFSSDVAPWVSQSLPDSVTIGQIAKQQPQFNEGVVTVQQLAQSVRSVLYIAWGMSVAAGVLLLLIFRGLHNKIKALTWCVAVVTLSLTLLGAGGLFTSPALRSLVESTIPLSTNWIIIAGDIVVELGRQVSFTFFWTALIMAGVTVIGVLAILRTRKQTI